MRNSIGTFWGQKSKMAKLAQMAVAAGPRAAIFEISTFLLKKLLGLSTTHTGAARRGADQGFGCIGGKKKAGYKLGVT